MKTLIIDGEPLTVPDNAIVLTTSKEGEWLRYHCTCGQSGVYSMLRANGAEDFYASARGHNIRAHRDTFDIIDRTGS